MSKQHFVERNNLLSEKTSEVSFLVVCAERPNISVINDVLKNVIRSAPIAISESLQGLYDLQKEWNKNNFIVTSDKLKLDIKDIIAERPWNPSMEIQDQLANFHLTSIDGASNGNNWLDNFFLHVQSVRYCHLRNIAKKGVDLDSVIHFEPKFTPDGDPASTARIRAAAEVIGSCDLRGQAKDLLERIIHDNSLSEDPISIMCMRPVRDHANSENSYNFQTATYAALLIE